MQSRSSHRHPESGPERAFGIVLRALREERGFSQEQLGLACNVDRTYVSLLERGLKSPTLRTMFRLSEILQSPFSEFAARIEAELRKSAQTPKQRGRSTGVIGKPD